MVEKRQFALGDTVLRISNKNGKNTFVLLEFKNCINNKLTLSITSLVSIQIDNTSLSPFKTIHTISSTNIICRIRYLTCL